MVNYRYLVLHQSEWMRLKDQAGEIKSSVQLKNAERQRMDELSKKMIDSWPDSLTSQTRDRKKYEEWKINEFMKEQTEIEKLKAKQANQRLKKNIQKARQKIFNASAYGKELLSALYQSKVLEERDAQIKLQKRMKQDAINIDKQYEINETNFVEEILKNDEQGKTQHNEKQLENALFNFNSYKTQKENGRKAKELEIQNEKEDARLMQKLLDYEKEQEKKCKEQYKKQFNEQVIENRMLEACQKKREQVDDALTDAHKKYLERVYCNEKKVLAENFNRHDSETTKNNYDLLEKLQQEENKRYEDFVDVGVKRYEKMVEQNHQATILKGQEKSFFLKECAEELKDTTPKEVAPFDRCKCLCWKQSLFTKGSKGINNKNPVKDTKRELDFLKPSQTLTEQLKERMKEPSPWNATKHMHAQFADQASKVLNECRYKYMARKVVDSYRKTNGLNAESLPIPNY